jgi:hypothetical protein
MAKNRLPVLVALILAAPLFASAADISGKVGPIQVVPIPGGIAAPALGSPLPVVGLTPLGVIPGAAPRVDAGIPQLPAMAQAAAPAALARAPQLSGPAAAGPLRSVAAPAGPASVGAPAAAGAGSFQRDSIADRLGRQSADISEAIGKDSTGLSGKEGLDQVYEFGRKNRGGSRDIGRGRGDSVTEAGMTIGTPGTRSQVDPASPAATFILNDERIPITGRAADYYLEAKRLQAVLAARRVNLEESMDVMDDAYAEVYAKLRVIEAVGASKHISEHNTHLPETLTWVDGYMEKDGRKIAVHTQRVFFHKASGATKAASEIAEGIRRIDKSIEQSVAYFAEGGRADQQFDGLDEVILGFDTRGYKEIKDHVKQREAEIRKQYGDRFSFAFTDDSAPMPADQKALRAELTRLVKKYKGDGLQRIIEGVTYSRYTGLLLELKTIEHRINEGAVIEQSGRDLFDDNGMYVTEFDVVSRMPDGRLIMDEAKSARVTLQQSEVLDDKFLYKLETYARNRALIERRLGGIPEISFTVDVGGIDRQAALEGEVIWKNPQQLQLVRFLQAQEKVLSEKYGFKVSFLFLSSYPGVDPHLVLRWLAANDNPENDKAVLKADKKARKHGRR